MRVVGIDPGFKGGVALFDTEKKELKAFSMPVFNGKKKAVNLLELRKILSEGEIDLVVIEEPQAMPRQGLVSTAHFFYWTGAVVGLCAGLQIPYRTVRARTWKKLLGLSNDKNESLKMASELFPSCEFKKGEDGKAEAALIAWWGRCLVVRGGNLA